MYDRISNAVFDEVVSPKEFARRVGAVAAFLGLVWGVIFGLPMLVAQPWFKALFPN